MRHTYLQILILIMTSIIALEVLYIRTFSKQPSFSQKTAVTTQAPQIPTNIPLEITEIKATKDISKQVTLYKKLIARVGTKQAQEDLFFSGLPFDGQTHLLNHTVGDVLYEKYGTSGILYCKDYFLSSCYHGFVIRIVADGGLKKLEDVMAICQKKGYPIAIQCSHAIGHGLLAWTGYENLTQALSNCDVLNKQIQKFPFYNCYDGVFMENIWAVHEAGMPSEDRWINPNDPVYPCNDSRIESQYIKACWSNQPTRMYQMFQGDIARVGKECLQLTDTVYKETCFDGLARQIHPITKGSAEETFRLCSQLPTEWRNECAISIAKASFSVGDRKVPYLICEQIPNDAQALCYEKLSGIITAYAQNPQEKTQWCNKISKSQFQNVCEKLQ